MSVASRNDGYRPAENCDQYDHFEYGGEVDDTYLWTISYWLCLGNTARRALCVCCVGKIK